MASSLVRTKVVPMIEQRMPTPATTSGSTARALSQAASLMAKNRGADSDQGQGRDHAADVGLEEVGTHAGDVADVVTDVVGDGGRVAGVVLGDARLDLADEVGADVSSLGVDAAADAGEQRDRRGAEGEAGHDGRVLEDDPQDGDTEQADADHGHAHHGAGAEGDTKRRVEAVHGRRCRADVAAGGDGHADETGQRRTDGAENVGDRGPRTSPEAFVDRGVRLRHGGVVGDVEVDQGGDDDGHDGHEDREDHVLAPQEGHGAFLDQATDLLDDLGAGVLRDDPAGQPQRGDETGDRRSAGDDECRCPSHQRGYLLSSTGVSLPLMCLGA